MKRPRIIITLNSDAILTIERQRKAYTETRMYLYPTAASLWRARRVFPLYKSYDLGNNRWVEMYGKEEA